MQTTAPERPAEQPRSERRNIWLPVLVGVVAVMIVLFTLGIWAFLAADSSDLTSDEQAMVDRVEELFDTLNAADVDAIPGFFTPDAELVSGFDRYTVDTYIAAMRQYMGEIPVTVHDALVSGNYVIATFTEEWETPVDGVSISEFDPETLLVKHVEWFHTTEPGEN